MTGPRRADDRPCALITGGARGIGRALALRLARDGWAIAYCYRTSADDARSLAAALAELDAPALAVRCDVSQPAACEALVGRTTEAFGRIDALVHGAGPYHRAPLLAESVEGWHEMFDHNLHPVFYLGRNVARHMQARRHGRIVTFAMARADRLMAQPEITGHYIAKAAVLALTRTLAKVLAPWGITANTVSPGYIDSGSSPAEELAEALPTIPAGYLGAVDDPVAVVHFLLSDAARYVNGANIEVGGAWGL